METADASNIAAEPEVMRNVLENESLLPQHHDVTPLLPKVRFPSCRLVFLVMGFLGFVNVYCLRVNLSVALVAMVKHPQVANLSQNNSGNNSGNVHMSSESTGETVLGKEDTKSGEFNWDSKIQGTVLAAFFYGYLTTQV